MRSELSTARPIRLGSCLVAAFLVFLPLLSCGDKDKKTPGTAHDAGPRGPEARGTRVVLITLDTLRYDSFAGESGNPSYMPNLLARAGRGVRFDRFYAATSTT